MKKILLILFLSAGWPAFTQVLEPVKWEYESRQLDSGWFELVFRAVIDNTWHLYSQDIPSGGPIPTSFHFNPSDTYQLDGGVVEKTRPEVKYDQSFSMNLKMYSNEAVFVQKVKLVGESASVTGFVEFMSCNDESCLPPREEEFEFRLGASTGPAVEARGLLESRLDLDMVPESYDAGMKGVGDEFAQKSLWGLFFISFLLGFAGLLTPCVYPMIPMTVTFFLRGSEKRGQAILKAIVFGLSIVFIYTGVGLIISLTSAGADFANVLSTHWIPNLVFFLLFLAFAASFLGMFEIILPTGLTNRADRRADRGGIIGAFFMALVLALVSFSCTGPIIGALLVQAATGEVLEPVVGMFGFSLAFALPFTLLAISPSMLKSLPKSGGWMNAVKVVLGFLVLAFGLKFLSNIDQAYHWGILTRDLYLSIWIVIFSFLGFYLAGKIRFAHDSELPHLSVPRLALAVVVFSFVVYMIPGLFGAPLRGISGLLPPAGAQQFDLAGMIMENRAGASFRAEPAGEICETPKYAGFLSLPYGLAGYYDYAQGMACARKLGKPVLLDFKGHACANCKEMESRVWTDPEVLKRLKNDFLIIALYTDDKTRLPEEEWISSDYDGKIKKTLGKVNGDLQISMFNTNAIPLYAIVDHEGNPLVAPAGYDADPAVFIRFLDQGKKAFEAR